MANNVRIDIDIGANVQSAISSIDQLQQSILSKPFKLNFDMGGMAKGGGGIQTIMGDAAGFFKEIESGAGNIEKLEIVYGRFLDKTSGQEVQVPIKAIQTMRGEAGQTVETFKTFNKQWLDMAKNGELVERTGTDKAILNIGQAARASEKELKTLDTQIQRAMQGAREFLAKAQNMSGPGVEAAKAQAQVVLSLGQAFNQAKLSGDTAAVTALGKELIKQNNILKENKAAVKGSDDAHKSWATSILTSLKNTISYSLSIGLVHKAMALFNDAIRYNIELNKELIKVQVLQAEGAQTDKEIQSLANSFNKLAKEMGTTTIEVAQGSVEWLRQGKTIAETQELLRSSIMLSKLGNLSAAESTEYLTSTLNSYKLSTEDAIQVVDKLVTVDNASATSTKELATALRYSAATASQAGVSLEKLISYIAVISSTTRINAESIGQSMKTIFTRMQDIKAGAIDEDGLGINNVAIALERVDIQLMESETEFRDMSDVLEELAGKWDTLSEVEQANISKAIAGVRQQNMFNVLMQNMGDAIELQTLQYKSLGTATDRYQIYLKGAEAAQNRYKASIEDFMQSRAMTSFIIGFYDTARGIIDVINGLGGLQVILPVIIALFIAFNIQTITATGTKGLQGLSTAVVSVVGGLSKMIPALAGVNTWLAASSVNVAIATAGISVLIGGLAWLISRLVQGKQGLKNFTDALSTASQKMREIDSAIQNNANNISKVEGLVKEYEKLNTQLDLTVEEESRLVDVQNELKNQVPLLAGDYDELGNFIITNTDATKDYIAAQKESLAIQKEQRAMTLKTELIPAQKNAIETARKDYDDIVEIRTLQQQELNRLKKAAEHNPDYTGAADYTLYSDTGDVTHTTASTRAEAIRALEERMSGLNDVVAEANLTWREANATLRMYEAEAEMAAASTENAADSTGKASKKLTSDSKSYASSKAQLFTEYRQVVESFANLEKDTSKLTAEDFALMDREGIKYYTDQSGVVQIAADSLGQYRDKLISNMGAKIELNDIDRENLKNIFDTRNAIEENVSEYDKLTGTIEAATAANAEQQETNQISLETISNLIGANESLAGAIEYNGVAYQFDKDKALQLLNVEMQSYFAKYNLGDAARYAAAGNYEMAIKAVLASQMVAQEKAELIELLGLFNQFAVAAPSGGGGGGKSPEEIAKEKAIELKEKEIKTLEDKKKALQDELEQFKKYIAAQKEALKLAKEEKDFQDELAKKSKDLAKLKARIAILSLDDSKEAIAERLKLEEQASEITEDIEKDKAKRTYDLQIQALDRVQKAFEDAIGKQMDGIEMMVDAIRALIEELRKASETASGSAGGVIDTVKVKSSELAIQLSDMYKEQFGLSDEATGKLEAQIDKWIGMKKPIQEVIELAERYAEILSGQFKLGINRTNVTAGNAVVAVPRHSGGLIESHHEGNFAGGLESNEVFAKLLKGEYVATEGQMDNFIKKTMPAIASRASSANTINLSMPITVEGNLDSSVIPQIDKIANKVIKEINKTMIIRGNVRSANQTIS